MMPVPDSTLDQILALQLTVAWAGEKPRLGWWNTDLLDPASGGDLFSRLLPRTHRWAALEAVREAARREDDRLRRTLAEPDQVRTLFHLGFELNERLSERLAHHKRVALSPVQALKDLSPLDPDLAQPFSQDTLADWLRPTSLKLKVESVPGGRQILGPPPGAPDLLARHLAAALVPFPHDYPAPFYRMPAP